jgi:competence protein ComEA
MDLRRAELADRDDVDVGVDVDPAPTRGERLAAWFRPTPAEAVGLTVLVVGAAVGSLVWWGQAVQRPETTSSAVETDTGSGAAVVGAGVDASGALDGPAPGEDVTGSGPATDGGAHAAHAGHDHGDPTTGPTGGEDDGVGDDPGTEGSAAAGQADAAPGAEAEQDDGEVVVHVSGAVAEPGLATLPAGSRVGEAVAAAGGLTDDAEPERVNLARPVGDGELVHVPREGEEPPETVGPQGGGQASTPSGEQGSGDGGGSEVGAEPDPIDLNHADEEQLEQLPGIGPARAAAIVEHRATVGPFATPGDVRDVPGIGEATFQRLAPLVSVS